MDMKPCLECGGEVEPRPEFGEDVAWCNGCPGYKASYTATRAAIVSRVLAEAVKDAAKVEKVSGLTLYVVGGNQNNIPPGTYALIPVKEDKP